MQARYTDCPARGPLPRGQLLELALLAAVTAVASGCGGTDFVDRQAVAGSVTIDGQPLAKALISFLPIGATPGPKASGVVVDGQYFIAPDDGPCPGEFIVKIEAISPEIEALAAGDAAAPRHGAAAAPLLEIAPQYNRESTLAATVRSGAENRFDFAVEAVK